MTDVYLFIYTYVKDYCITGRANVISVPLAFAEFPSKIKWNFWVSAVSMHDTGTVLKNSLYFR